MTMKIELIMLMMFSTIISIHKVVVALKKDKKDKVDMIIKWSYYIITSIELFFIWLYCLELNPQKNQIQNLFDYKITLSRLWLPTIIINTFIFLIVDELRNRHKSKNSFGNNKTTVRNKNRKQK